MDNAELNFQQLYDEYQTRIFRYLTRMIGDVEAEDLTQEVFIKIGQSLDTFRGESQLSTWIYRIANNAALDRLRSPYYAHGKKMSVEDMVETDDDKYIWPGEQQDSSEQKLINEEMNGCIREVIETLPETYRSVIVLSEVEGFKDIEIAEITGLSLQAVKIRLHRARTKLKKELTKSCTFYRNEHNEFACDRKGNGD
jgi:RNA polymerase sigma-70 factor, ECF subfamily